MRRSSVLGSVLCALLLAIVFVHDALGQEGSRFFDSTGQTLDHQYGFLQFWDAHNGADLLGDPLTGVLFEANVPVQYFERGRLEQRDGAVVPGAIGSERTRWRTFDPAPPRTVQGVDQTFANGHTLNGAFLDFWRAHEGELMFGAPISEPLWEQVGGANIRVQYFERGRLEHHSALAAGTTIKVSALGREVALAKGLITPEQKPAIQVAQAVNADQLAAAFGQLAPPTPISTLR